MRFVVRTRHGQRFHHGRERLLEIKIWIAFPARIDLELPTHARERRADQPIIDLLWDRPIAGVDSFQRASNSRDQRAVSRSRRRPIALSAGPLHAIHIVAGERRVLPRHFQKSAASFCKSLALVAGDWAWLLPTRESERVKIAICFIGSEGHTYPPGRIGGAKSIFQWSNPGNSPPSVRPPASASSAGNTKAGGFQSARKR